MRNSLTLLLFFHTHSCPPHPTPLFLFSCCLSLKHPPLQRSQPPAPWQSDLASLECTCDEAGLTSTHCLDSWPGVLYHFWHVISHNTVMGGCRGNNSCVSCKILGLVLSVKSRRRRTEPAYSVRTCGASRALVDSVSCPLQGHSLKNSVDSHV